jgi:hypothetical protein
MTLTTLNKHLILGLSLTFLFSNHPTVSSDSTHIDKSILTPQTHEDLRLRGDDVFKITKKEKKPRKEPRPRPDDFEDDVPETVVL